MLTLKHILKASKLMNCGKGMRSSLASVSQPIEDYKTIRRLERSVEFYEIRMNALQEYQKKLPEPHRTEICNILANGRSG